MASYLTVARSLSTLLALGALGLGCGGADDPALPPGIARSSSPATPAGPVVATRAPADGRYRIPWADPGTIPTGSACKLAEHCGGDDEAWCLHRWPGGYCTRQCRSHADCEPYGGPCGGWVADAPGLCFHGCESDAACRPGYACMAGICWAAAP